MKPLARQLAGKSGRRLAATDARIHFGELLDAVTETGQAFELERSGEPVIAIVKYDDNLGLFEPPEWLTNLHQIQDEMRAHLAGRSLRPTPEEIIRRDRDRR